MTTDCTFTPLTTLRCAALSLLFTATFAAHAQDTRPSTPALVYGPYKHLNTGVDPAKPVATTHVTGQALTLANGPREALLPEATAIALAFASGECGQETWGGLDANKVAQANVQALDQAQRPYIISTGGEGNVFTCTTDTGMERFVQRYESPSLLGFDFDIEHTQTPAAIQSLVARIKVAQAKRPKLRWSFTLPTFAASDASRASLNPLGLQVLSAIREAQLEGVIINLMVMNYGKANPGVCVVKDAQCDMGASAIQAARNLNAVHGVPFERIALTAMIGVNDVVENVFTLQDAINLARFAKKEKIGGLHFWSLDRDTPCPGGATAVSPTCSSLNTQPTLAFSRAFAWGLR